MLSISIALNALSTHGACTAVFVAVAAIIGFIFCSIQTLGRITWLAWVGVLAIISASKLGKINSRNLRLKHDSLDTDGRGWSWRPSSRSTAKWALEVGLQDHWQPLVRGCYLSDFFPGVRLRWYTWLLPYCFRDARPSPIHSLAHHLPVHCDSHIHCHRGRGLLLLWIIRRISRVGVCRSDLEESLLRSCFARTLRKHHLAFTRKSK